MGKHQTFTVPSRINEKVLELGARCLIMETFSYLSGVIYLIGRSPVPYRWGITILLATWDGFTQSKFSVYQIKSMHLLFDFLSIAIFYGINKIISREHLHNQFYFSNPCNTMRHINMNATKTVLCVCLLNFFAFFCLVCYLQILNDGCSILLEALCISDLELLRIYSGTHVHVYYKRNSRINTDWW